MEQLVAMGGAVNRSGGFLGQLQTSTFEVLKNQSMYHLWFPLFWVLESGYLDLDVFFKVDKDIQFKVDIEVLF